VFLNFDFECQALHKKSAIIATKHTRVFLYFLLLGTNSKGILRSLNLILQWMVILHWRILFVNSGCKNYPICIEMVSSAVTIKVLN
jgi:hypothetical protein